MTVEIRLAQNNDAKEWNSIISQSPHGTLFHEWDWLKIIEKHTSTRFYPLIGMKKGEPIGVIPLFFQKKGPIRMVFSPPPHAGVFYLGPVLAGCDPFRQEKLENIYFEFQKCIENFMSEDLNAQYALISLAPALQDPRPFKWSGYSIQPHFDYAVDLSSGVDSLFSSLDRKQRSDIKRAKEREMIFGIGGEKEYEQILDLMDIRYAHQGKIVTVSRSYFIDLFKTYKHNIILSSIKIEGEVVTGTIHLKYRDTIYNWQGNPKPIKTVTPSPNDLLIWESIRYACENGFKYYTTMSAAGNKRLHTYYAAKCNPALIVRYTVSKKSLLAGIFENGYVKIIKPLREKVRYLGQSNVTS
jgi:hypothetical protein